MYPTAVLVCLYSILEVTAGPARASLISETARELQAPSPASPLAVASSFEDALDEPSS